MRFYLDHNATSPLRDRAASAWLAVSGQGALNAGSTHADGRRTRRVLESARAELLDAIEAPGGQLVFCSGATEANNLALRAEVAGVGPLVSSRLEHPSVRRVLDERARAGRDVRWLPHDETGRIDPIGAQEVLAGASLCALMAANNELGNLNPVEAIASLCRELGVALHIDATQVVGRWPWRVPDGTTSIAFSAHKAGGPVGIGALWVASGHVVHPAYVGGHQERGARPGTEAVALAAAMAAVVAVPDPAWSRLGTVRDALEAALLERGGIANGDRTKRLANTLNFSWPGVGTEEALIALDLAGYSLSGGSACAAGSLEPSPVIAALGLAPERSTTAMRISLGPEHADADGDELGRAMAEVLESVRIRREGSTLRSPRRA